MILAFNKPYGVLSQFTAKGSSAPKSGASLQSIRPAAGGKDVIYPPQSVGGSSPEDGSTQRSVAENSRSNLCTARLRDHLTQQQSGQRTLAAFGFPKHVYPIGRLDWDSEGLLLLSDEKEWNDLLLHPRHAHERTYHVQVEGLISEAALSRLREGVMIQNRRTKPCSVKILKDPRYPPRCPPIRFRLSVPTCWIELKLIEGKNRQVRRMTAAVGFPTLRLIRTAIGAYASGDLPEGKWRELGISQRQLLTGGGRARKVS